MRHRTGILRAFALTTLALVMVAGIATPAGAISRADVLKRAKVWVSNKVPYSQSRWATVDGVLVPATTPKSDQMTKGYRTDCSGFVSMSLDFRSSKGAIYSADTGGLGRLLIKITKSELRPGDVILRPNDLKIDGVRVPYGHAVIFGGWINAAQTEYWALHESSSAKGTVMSKVKYGTSGFGTEQGFAPYRHPGVRERIRAPRTFGQ